MAGWFSSNPFGAALGAVGSIAGGIIQNEENKKMMREQMRWNTSEREASQNFTRAERVAQQGYQTSEREAQNAWSESMYKNFQSPEALRAQYSAAGLDPALAISGNAAPAASSGSSGSAPSGASSPTMGITPPYQNMNSFAQGFGELATAMKSLADAKRTGVDIKLAEATLNDCIEIVHNDAAMSKLNIDWTKIKTEKDIQEIENLKALNENTKTSTKQMEAAIYKLVQDGKIAKQVADTFMEDFRNRQENLKADTANKEADSSLKGSQESLNKARESLTKAQESLTWLQHEATRADINLKDKQAYAAFNEGYLNRVRASFEGMSKPERHKLLIHELDKVEKTRQAFIDEMNAKAKEAIAKGDFAKAQQISEIIMKSSIAFNQVMSGISSASGLGSTTPASVPSLGGSVAIPFN